MTVSAINGTTATSTSTASSSSTSNSTGVNGTLNYNEFLNLLVAQLKNQDPTNPADPTTFVSQLASFSSVEQQVNANSKLDSLLTSDGDFAGRFAHRQDRDIVGRFGLGADRIGRDFLFRPTSHFDERQHDQFGQRYQSFLSSRGGRG